MFIKFNKLERHIGKQQNTFIIAEIGQNHQGDINIAKNLIRISKDSGADCVKFQKSDLNEKFNKAALERPYLSSNSFGKTYGEHKTFLEFSKDQFKELQQYADNTGIFFTASAMDPKSLEFLEEIKVPFIKIGSGDANNLLLIEKAAKTNIPLVISTGMQDFTTVKQIYDIVSCYHKNFALLHCVSSYPTPANQINLKVLELYQREFPDVITGYSGHELGISIAIAAVTMGSKVIERHITFDKTQKGSDHKCSLEPQEFKQMVDDIRIVEKAIGHPIKVMQTCEIPCFEKLGKTLVYAKSFKKGHVIVEGDILVKVAEPKGINGCKLYQILNTVLVTDVTIDASVEEKHLQLF